MIHYSLFYISKSLKLALNHLLLIIIFAKMVITEHTGFINECGKYQGEELTSNFPTKEDCLGYPVTNSSTTCCYVTGNQNLTDKSACFEIIDTEKERIKFIQEAENFATKIKVNCGSKRELKSDCSFKTDSPKNKDDCKDNSLPSGYKCCYVKIKSDDFNGEACRKFEDIDSEKIGEAVVAAKTIDVDLTVKCNATLFNSYNVFKFLIYICLIIVL